MGRVMSAPFFFTYTSEGTGMQVVKDRLLPFVVRVAPKIMENPRSRLKELVVQLVVHPTLSHIAIGGFIGSYLSNGNVWGWLVFLVLSVVLYSLGDDIQKAAREAEERLLPPAEGRHYGIE